MRQAQNLPDFSKANFPNIANFDLRDRERNKEVLLKNSSDDSEENFRFLKKYYKEKLNFDKSHFYFSLEIEKKNQNTSFFKWLPYWLYEITSNYGKSLFRPIVCLALFAFIFAFVNMPNDDYFQTKKHSSNGFFSTKIGVSFGDSFSRIAVFSPILTKSNEAFDFKKYSRFKVTIQTALNIIFWFLLLLGIKNKFQIK